MEHVSTLIVLTLLQLCTAEIPKALPGWYAANLINDGNYSPKPISEIFTTQSTFPADNQVFVVQSSQSPITQDIVATSAPTTWSTGTFNTQSTSFNQNQFPNIAPDQSNIQGLLPKDLSSIAQTTELPSYQSTQGTTNLRSDVTNILDNIYQTGQNQNYSPFQPTAPTVSVTPSTIQTWIPTQSTPQSSLSTNAWTTYSTTPSPLPRETLSTLPPYIPTFPPRSRNNIRPNVPIPSNIRPCDLTPEKLKPVANISSPTLLSPVPKNVLTIRLKAPRGSITNLHINPSTSTTTKRPTTTRRRKSTKGKNDHAICLDSCKERRDPICASPTGISPIDSNTLKGFPSICHMACHNTFKKEPAYEKVAEGRCGRLRTRIRTIEKNKMKREDLNKAQYTVSHSGPETVVEFSSLKR